MGDGLAAYHPRTGRTDLHFFHRLMHDVMSPHSSTDKESKVWKEHKLIMYSKDYSILPTQKLIETL
jgi:hypothetical protein